jgi:hypothetical protein
LEKGINAESWLLVFGRWFLVAGYFDSASETVIKGF